MMKIVLLFMMSLCCITTYAQSVSEQKQQYAKEEQHQKADIFVLNNIGGLGISSETRDWIDDALVCNLGEDFEKMTPLQKKNYLSSEEGKNRIAEFERRREGLFAATWCFGFELEGNNSDSKLKNVFYHLEHERMMLNIATCSNGEPLDIHGDQFEFDEKYLYNIDYAVIKIYFLGLPCSEEVATEIESNDRNLVLYLYFKVPDMDAVTIKYGRPHLAVKVDRVELRNKITGKIYITTTM